LWYNYGNNIEFIISGEMVGGFVLLRTISPEIFRNWIKLLTGLGCSNPPLKVKELKLNGGSHPSHRAKRFKRNMDNEKKEVVVDKKVEEPIIDPITAKDEEIARLTEERDNYKNVALKRLGKLPGDAEFVAGEKTELSVEEQVRITLLDREIQKANKEKEDVARNLAKENAELRLALKNRPGVSIGGGSGDNLEVKDNVLSEAQIINLKARAVRLKVDPDKFVEQAKANLLKNR
jgi:hypothetical protein